MKSICALVLISYLILIIGTTYLVGWCGWSMWTYLLTLLLCSGIGSNFECKIRFNGRESNE